MNFFKILKPFFLMLPTDEYIFKCCKKYCDRYNGENEGDMSRNGELHFVHSQSENLKTIFDIGANRGDWTRSVLKAQSKAEFHCFEPSKDIFLDLQSQLWPDRVRLVNAALSSQEGAGNYDRETGSLHRDNLRTGTSRKAESVKLLTIDDYCRNQNIKEIDLMKVDVEGHELDVFRGATQLLSEARIKSLYFEYNYTFINSRVLLKDIFEFFADKHYSIFKLLPDGVQHIKEYDYRLENFNYKHFAVLRNV